LGLFHFKIVLIRKDISAVSSDLEVSANIHNLSALLL
jgi:hypothetical protein